MSWINEVKEPLEDDDIFGSVAPRYLSISFRLWGELSPPQTAELAKGRKRTHDEGFSVPWMLYSETLGMFLLLVMI